MSAHPAIPDGPAPWLTQAHVPSVLGRQIVATPRACYVHTTDGRRLLDGTAGLGHVNIGHAGCTSRKTMHRDHLR
jgi:adenosylmethionine-8-amino-7-oxononanoate aminotransferase